MLRVMSVNNRRRKINEARASARRSRRQASAVLINDVGPKRYIRRSVQKLSMQNIVSYARHVTKVMSAMTFVSFASKSTLAREMHKMTTNGLDVMSVTDGYICVLLLIEPYLV